MPISPEEAWNCEGFAEELESVCSKIDTELRRFSPGCEIDVDFSRLGHRDIVITWVKRTYSIEGWKVEVVRYHGGATGFKFSAPGIKSENFLCVVKGVA